MPAHLSLSLAGIRLALPHWRCLRTIHTLLAGARLASLSLFTACRSPACAALRCFAPHTLAAHTRTAPPPPLAQYTVIWRVSAVQCSLHSKLKLTERARLYALTQCASRCHARSASIVHSIAHALSSSILSRFSLWLVARISHPPTPVYLCAICQPMQSFETTIYRKPTYTGQYTRWDAFTARKHKINLVRCLTNRAARICSPQRLDEELDCIRKIFANNGYPLHVVNRTIRNA